MENTHALSLHGERTEMIRDLIQWLDHQSILPLQWKVCTVGQQRVQANALIRKTLLTLQGTLELPIVHKIPNLQSVSKLQCH